MSSKFENPNYEELLKHASWLKNLALHLVKDAALADDIVQQTWVTAIEKPPRKNASTRHWLGRVLRNNIHNRYREESRRKRREARYASRSGDEFVDQVVERGELSAVLTQAVLRLNEPFRSTLLMRFHEDLSSKEIGRRLGIPAGTVRTRVNRGLGKLRQDLELLLGRDGEELNSMLLAFSSVTGGSFFSPAFLVAAALLVGLGLTAWVFDGFTREPPLTTKGGAITEVKIETDAMEPALLLHEESPSREEEDVASDIEGGAAVIISGRCIAEETGEPLAGCELHFFGYEARSPSQFKQYPEWAWQNPEDIITGVDGRFEFRLGQPHELGLYILSIKKDGRLTRRADWTAPDNPLRDFDFGDINLQVGTILKGRVLSMDGRPLDDVRVHLDEVPGQILLNASRGAYSLGGRTDKEGNFDVGSALPPGTRNVKMHKVGYGQVDPFYVEIFSGLSEQSVDFYMQAMPFVQGKVSMIGGAPLIKAEVTADVGPGWIASARTNDLGEFKIFARELRDTPFRLEVEHDNVQNFATEEVHHWGDRGITLVARPALQVAIQVVEDATGERVEKFAVISGPIEPNSRHGVRGYPKNGGTHAEGILLLEGLRDKDNGLIVLPWNPKLSRSQPIPVKPSVEGELLEVRLQPAKPFEVKVVNQEGNGVAGSVVSATHPIFESDVYSKFTTERDGVAVLYLPVGLQEGLLVVTGDHKKEVIELNHEDWKSGERSVTVTSLGTVKGTLKLTPAFESVRLYFRNKENHSEIHWSYDSPKIVEVANDGQFEEKLEPGVFDVRLLVKNLNPGSSGSIHKGWAAWPRSIGEVEIHAGKSSALDLDLSDFALSTLKGKLTVNQLPLSGADVHLRFLGIEGDSNWGEGYQDLRTGANGEFEVHNLLPGSYRLWLQSGRNGEELPWRLISRQMFEVKSGQSNEVAFDFQLTTARIRPLDPATNQPMPNTTWYVPPIRKHLTTDSLGWLTIFPAPQGEFVLSLNRARPSTTLGPLAIQFGEELFVVEAQATALR